jgi:hypothetical protein
MSNLTNKVPRSLNAWSPEVRALLVAIDMDDVTIA